MNKKQVKQTKDNNRLNKIEKLIKDVLNSPETTFFRTEAVEVLCSFVFCYDSSTSNIVRHIVCNSDDCFNVIEIQFGKFNKDGKFERTGIYYDFRNKYFCSAHGGKDKIE